jgi:hypothetical protein
MTTESVRDDLIRLEHAYWQALSDQDAESAVRLSDDPTTIVGASGVTSLDRASLGSLLGGASYALQAFELKDVTVRLLTDDVAIVAYTVHEDLVLDGAELSIDAADASTWVRREGTWVCALHTESIAGDPFGRDRGAVVPST